MAKLMILADECMSDPFCADYPILDMPNILYRMLFRKPRFFLEIPSFEGENHKNLSDLLQVVFILLLFPVD